MELKVSILHLVFSLSVSMDICNRQKNHLEPQRGVGWLPSLFETVIVAITQYIHTCNYMIVFVYIFACHICYRLVDSLRDITY